MKKILSIVLSSLVFALAIPFAYGQQLCNPTNPISAIDQNTTNNSTNEQSSISYTPYFLTKMILFLE